MPSAPVRASVPTRARAVQRLRAVLLRRRYPRLQMLAIVALTGGVGLLASFGLHAAGLHAMALRYPAAVALAYLAFLGLLSLWLRWSDDERDALGELANDLDDLHRRTRGDASEALETDTPADGDAPASGVLDALGAADEGLPLVLLLLLLALAAALLFALANVVWAAPTLFAELLFDGVLSLGLYRRLRRADARHWLDSAWRRTAWPFALACASSALLGAALQWIAPGATTLAQVLTR